MRVLVGKTYRVSDKKYAYGPFNLVTNAIWGEGDSKRPFNLIFTLEDTLKCHSFHASQFIKSLPVMIVNHDSWSSPNKTRFREISPKKFLERKVGFIFSMVILAEFRMGQHSLGIVCDA